MAKYHILASRLMRDIARELENLTDTQLEMLEAGDLEIRFTICAKTTKKLSKDTFDPPNDFSAEEIVTKIRACSDRATARSTIESMLITKRHLQESLKYIGANGSPSENRETMIERLISSTIGTRLRSEAIQSLGADKGEQKKTEIDSSQ